MLTRVRNRCRRKGRDFDLREQDVTIPDICPVFGIPLRASKDRLDDNSPSLDRLDNTKGYIRGNVRVISWKANRLKSSASLEDIRTLLRWMESEMS